ncbi:tyrosine-type recombinase/integrase [Ureibacillus thermosphaericus]|uniref:tyrosine-type recombinase/integrase n=1 Tax=Ureibacillus thermosphaericus TaxID=51173 RepID=UPI0030ED8B7F
MVKIPSNLERAFTRNLNAYSYQKGSCLLTARAIQKMLTKYADLTNMENVTPHRFRHSFCKNLANAGTPIEIIRRFAWHESIQTTVIYVDASREGRCRR